MRTAKFVYSSKVSPSCTFLIQRKLEGVADSDLGIIDACNASKDMNTV